MAFPRLIEFHGPMLDPSFTSEETANSVEEATLTFRAEFDQPACQYDVYNLPICPQYFSDFTYNGRRYPKLKAIKRSCSTLHEAPQVVVLHVSYSSNWLQFFGGQYKFIPNPLERPALVEWGRYSVREPVETARGIDNDVKVPVATTAGEPLIMEEEFNRRSITIVKNIRSSDPYIAIKDCINSDACVIGGHTFPPLTLWMLPPLIGPLQFENEVWFYEMTMHVYHNPDTWIRRIRNAGYYMKDYNATDVIDPKTLAITPVYKLIPIQINGLGKTDRPVLLDKEGHPLTAKILKITPAGLTPKYDYIIQSPDDYGKAFTPAQLKESTRYFRTRDKIRFSDTFPLL